ncbi:hypothetical protein AURDEDRAFT_150336 [Auricularia subglabra TFB-10046 SS5]|nr:hypothetical protein AURDEDRAFT_150336 [Auricularia subglabra TFB-10046 SS5]
MQPPELSSLLEFYSYKSGGGAAFGSNHDHLNNVTELIEWHSSNSRRATQTGVGDVESEGEVKLATEIPPKELHEKLKQGGHVEKAQPASVPQIYMRGVEKDRVEIIGDDLLLCDTVTLLPSCRGSLCTAPTKVRHTARAHGLRNDEHAASDIRLPGASALLAGAYTKKGDTSTSFWRDGRVPLRAIPAYGTASPDSGGQQGASCLAAPDTAGAFHQLKSCIADGGGLMSARATFSTFRSHVKRAARPPAC